MAANFFNNIGGPGMGPARTLNSFMQSLGAHQRPHRQRPSPSRQGQGQGQGQGHGHGQGQGQGQGQAGPTGAAAAAPARPPPASARAIRHLPTVTVQPEDLVDESNRECCICLGPHRIGDRAVRLPCAHIYHPGCISDWLGRSRTCPVCRYELPTDDAAYEAGRQGRMASRRPRYAMHELGRLPARELLELAGRVGMGRGVAGMERADLVEALAGCGRVEIIAAPEPVSHRLADLRAMGVGRLRRTMEEAGVFFDPVDVVEKEDMVRIFVDSGRLVSLEGEEGEDGHCQASRDNNVRKGGAMEMDVCDNVGEAADDAADEASHCQPANTMSSRDLDADGATVEADGEIGRSEGSLERRVEAYAKQSVSELRSKARERGINVSDCIEKKEMARRLALAIP